MQWKTQQTKVYVLLGLTFQSGTWVERQLIKEGGDGMSVGLDAMGMMEWVVVE